MTSPTPDARSAAVVLTHTGTGIPALGYLSLGNRDLMLADVFAP